MMNVINLSVPLRARWIESLIKEHNWTTGAELGVQEGRTYLHLLESCSDLILTGVDLWSPNIARKTRAKNLDEFNDSINYEYFQNLKKKTKKYGERAILHRMFTLEAAKIIDNNSLDFIFVDADHNYEGVYNDIKSWLPKIKDDGWILGHDINWPSVKKAVDELIPGYIIGLDNCWGRAKTL